MHHTPTDGLEGITSRRDGGGGRGRGVGIGVERGVGEGNRGEVVGCKEFGSVNVKNNTRLGSIMAFFDVEGRKRVTHPEGTFSSSCSSIIPNGLRFDCRWLSPHLRNTSHFVERGRVRLCSDSHTEGNVRRIGRLGLPSIERGFSCSLFPHERIADRIRKQIVDYLGVER